MEKIIPGGEGHSVPAMAAFLEPYPGWEGFHCSRDGDRDQHPIMQELKILLECGWAQNVALCPPLPELSASQKPSRKRGWREVWKGGEEGRTRLLPRDKEGEGSG